MVEFSWWFLALTLLSSSLEIGEVSPKGGKRSREYNWGNSNTDTHRSLKSGRKNEILIS
jgi:hypothetical protein